MAPDCPDFSDSFDLVSSLVLSLESIDESSSSSESSTSSILSSTFRRVLVLSPFNIFLSIDESFFFDFELFLDDFSDPGRTKKECIESSIPSKML